MTIFPDHHLFHNLILFGRLLRALGIDVNPGRMVDLVRALDYVEIGKKPDFYFTLRSLLVHEQDEYALFDEAFNRFWRKRTEDDPLYELFQFRPQAGPQEEPIVTAPPLKEPESLGLAEEGDELLEVLEITQTYSSRELLRQKDFADLTQEELQAIKWIMSQMVWDLGMRRTRRLKAGKGMQFDLRRSLRQNLRYGGEILEWPRREAKFKPRPIIILADISGSMERYTRLLLHFIYSMSSSLTQSVESFVFSTKLSRITRQLKHQDIDHAIHEVSSSVHDWSGGTRIGDALKTFNFDWGRRVLGRGAIVLLISDGWDRGDPELLRMEIGRLQRSCYRLVWLNPLLGSERYEPLTRGMQAALPNIDDFLPVHNLSSLEDLATHLLQLTNEKRTSRQNQISLKGSAFIRGR